MVDMKNVVRYGTKNVVHYGTKNVVHYGAAFVTLGAKIELEQNGTATLLHWTVNTRADLKMSSTWTLNNEFIDSICEEAAKHIIIDGRSQPKLWTDRAVTCIFYAGTVDPNATPKQCTSRGHVSRGHVSRGHVFDVMCSYKTFDGKVRTEIVRMQAPNKSSPATLEFYENLQKKIYGSISSELTPAIHSITCVSSK